MARAGAASFTEQAGRVERRWTQQFDPTTDSRREQSQTQRRRLQGTDGVLQQLACLVSRGQFAPSNSHSLVFPAQLCYETCGSTRTEQTWEEYYIIQSSWAPERSCLYCTLSTLCSTPYKWEYDCVLSSRLLFSKSEVWHLLKCLKLKFVFAV